MVDSHFVYLICDDVLVNKKEKKKQYQAFIIDQKPNNPKTVSSSLTWHLLSSLSSDHKPHNHSSRTLPQPTETVTNLPTQFICLIMEFVIKNSIGDYFSMKACCKKFNHTAKNSFVVLVLVSRPHLLTLCSFSSYA